MSKIPRELFGLTRKEVCEIEIPIPTTAGNSEIFPKPKRPPRHSNFAIAISDLEVYFGVLGERTSEKEISLSRYFCVRFGTSFGVDVSPAKKRKITRTTFLVVRQRYYGNLGYNFGTILKVRKFGKQI